MGTVAQQGESLAKPVPLDALLLHSVWSNQQTTSNQQILTHALDFVCQVYVWGRRHPYVNLSFLGIFNFTAPYLPWVLLAFSVTLRSNAAVDLLGIVAGAHACQHVAAYVRGNAEMRVLVPPAEHDNCMSSILHACVGGEET